MSLTEKNLSKFNKTKSSWGTESNSSFESRKPPIVKPRNQGYQSDTTWKQPRRAVPPVGVYDSPPSSGDESTVRLNDIISRLNNRKKRVLDNETPKMNHSDSEINLSTKKEPESKPSIIIPNGYSEIFNTELESVKYNTLLCYISAASNRLICGKYFKRFNQEKGSLVISKYKHNRINFAVPISDIKSVYIRTDKDTEIKGGTTDHDTNMKDTIEIPKKDWSSIARDTVISYKKTDGTWKYKLKFGALKTSQKTGKAYFHLTTETGYNYKVMDSNIDQMYRHFTSSDKSLVQILTAIKRLDARLSIIESKFK